MATTYFAEKELLAPPTERGAFSDRQAYVCAELSKLAYFKFEGGYSLQQTLDLVSEIFGDDSRAKELEQQLRVVLSDIPSSSSDGELALHNILKAADFKLIQPISNESTQAFFCTRKVNMESGGEKVVAYLVFRGTEPKDFGDIKTDVKATLVDVKVGSETITLHSGYHDAFELVKDKIEDLINNTSYDQLFITGHSLGGALAMVTTRILASEITGACYTFGAPPIGTVGVQNKLKTPVYEIINEIDIVPRLPNPWMTSAILLLFRLFRIIAKAFTWLDKLLLNGTWDEKLEDYVKSMTLYRHPGYISYLVGSGNNAKLRYNVSSFDRFRWFFSMTWKRNIWHFNKMVGDHSIDVYVAKLKTHGINRQ